MATTKSYTDIKSAIDKKLESIAKTGNAIDSGVQQSGTVEQAQIPRFTVTDIPPLPVIDFPALQDLEFNFGITNATKQDIFGTLAIDKETRKNTFTEPQIIFNSSRIIANAKSDYLMLFGNKGVSVSSPNYVNIDADDQVALYGKTGIFVGVPGNGETPGNTTAPKRKGDPTIDVDYEPLILGNKLANLLEDLLIILKNATVVAPVGVSHFREDVQYEFACIQARIPEILSTIGYIDGISHNKARPAPEPPTTVTVPPTRFTGATSVDPPSPGGVGNAVGGSAVNPEDYPEGFFESGPTLPGFDELK